MSDEDDLNGLGIAIRVVLAAHSIEEVREVVGVAVADITELATELDSKRVAHQILTKYLDERIEAERLPTLVKH